MSSLHVVSGPPLHLTEAAEVLLEARADPRVGIDIPVQLSSRDFRGGIEASARDLSVGGVCVATSSLMAFRSIEEVKLTLPDGPMTLKVEGRWQTEATGGDSLLGGLSFLEPTRDEIARLWNVVHDASKDLSLFLFESSDFQELCADDASNLAECSRFRIIQGRKRIYAQDECRPGDDSIFLVLRGTVSLRVRIGRRELPFQQLSPGSVFGGLPVVADVPNQDSAVADGDAKLLEISRGSFSYLRVAKPLLAQRLAQLVTRTHLQRSRRLLGIAAQGEPYGE